MKILFINHKRSQCGVYEFGRNIGLALKNSKYEFLYCECDSISEFKAAVKANDPDLIIYNHHPATMPWLTSSVTRKIKLPHIGIIHEVTQTVADQADNSVFDFHIAHDPTLLLKNPLVFKAGRLIPCYENSFELPSVTTIGNFGFAGKKGQKRIVEMVQDEFDEAIVRINIPFATFGDADGQMALVIADECRNVVTKPGIELDITHEFWTEPQLLDFLAQNTINLFLYEYMDEQRGISGTPDIALAVQRPIGITRQSMFRHILGAKPSICVDDISIKEIIKNGIGPLKHFYEEWTEEMMCWEYERIVKTAFLRWNISARSNNNTAIRKVKRLIKRGLGIPVNDLDSTHSWIADTSINSLKQDASQRLHYQPAAVPSDWPINNILDDTARNIYEPTIEQMLDFLPELMVRKIPAANVQQAFVLDTVYKFVSKIDDPKILCIGSFEDSAAESLKLLGYKIEEIDPMINYDLNTFMTKPTTSQNSYDIVFSTSVIEHVENDEEFIENIAALLKPNGIAVLTCDYLDSYKPGDPKPVVDYRLYTQKDIKERLMMKVPDCKLFDAPQWDCPNPDFWYEGVNYTFASIVLRKTR